MVGTRLLCGLSMLALAAGPGSAAADSAYVYSQQDILIGADLVHGLTAGGQAITGAGVTFGVIDTGIAAPWVGFGGRIAPLPTSLCVMSICKQSVAVTDDNGHGTFVASEIIGSVPSAGFVGVAPGGTAVAIKALNAQGSGSYLDVANGIIAAVDQGAKVLNLSLGPFVQYAPLIGAINHAAAKGAVIVFAGGNSATVLSSGVIAGLTDQAIQSLIFTGSTDAAKQLSGFSNTPGASGFVSTTGKFYAYDTRWLMADGEMIWGASNYHTAQYGYDYVTQMSGTSMTAPQAAGAVGLLLQRWPFLTGAQLTALLLANAQDLGAPGTDATYGAGFLNVYNAFVTPTGTLSVAVGGHKVPVASAASIVSGSAFGGLGKLAGALQHFVAYDDFNRDFPIALGALVTSKTSTAPSAAAAVAMGQSGAGARNFSELGQGDWIVTSFSGTPTAPAWASYGGRPSPSLLQDPTQRQQADWSVGLSTRGVYMGVGQGANEPLSFSDARWGGKTAFFGSNASVGGTLLGLTTSGSSFAAAGVDLGRGGRVSFAALTAADDTLARLTGTGAAAHGVALGYTVALSDGVKLSATGSYLGERNMLLGSPSGGYLAFGSAARTMSVGLGINVALGNGYQLGLDSEVASTDPAQNADSLIGATSRLASAAFGVALRKDGAFAERDAIGIGLRRPMRVYAGNASLDLPVGTDAGGNPVIQPTRASLVPAGAETDLELTYDCPLDGVTTAGLSLTYRNDADNIAGATDGAAMVRLKVRF